MPKTVNPDGFEFTITVDRPVETFHDSGHHEPDSKWRYTDENDHKHRWIDGELPTLKWVVTRTYWCEECSDEHEEGDWRCVKCRAIVEPGYRWTGPQSFQLPGLIDARLEVRNGDFFTTWVLRKNEVDALYQGEPSDLRDRVKSFVETKQPDIGPTYAKATP